MKTRFIANNVILLPKTQLFILGMVKISTCWN